METITFNCKVITPMFLAGADGQTPELRAPSIKGAMRFWWRACNGHLVKKDEKTGEWDYSKLKEREGKIFGDTNNRSKFSMRVVCEDFEPSLEDFNHTFYTYDGNSRRRNGKAFPTNPMFYLGYGVANWVKEEKRTRFVRPYISPRTRFKIIVRVVETSVLNDLLIAFSALFNYGAIGSKSRNGFGCIKLTEIKSDGGFVELPEIDISSIQSETTGFSSFSKKVEVFETNKTNYQNWEEAFTQLAVAYQYARENIESWHEWYSRELIALPIVVKGERDIDDNFLERHSKPYFFNISQSKDGYLGRIICIPYNYLEGAPNFSDEKLRENREEYFEVLDSFNKLLQKNLLKQ